MSSLVYNRENAKPVYISSEVVRWLWLLAKAAGCSADQMAERILVNEIFANNIEVIKGQKKLDELEKEIIQSLKP